MTFDGKRLPLFFLIVGAVLRISIAVQEPLRLLQWPLNDDSFYYMNIAWNLTHGGGLRHDSFDTTTGFQPLFLVIIAPAFWVAAGKLQAINLALLVQTVVGLAGGVSLYRLGRRFGSEAGLVLVAIWAVSPVFLQLDLNGMETSLTLYLLVVTTGYFLARFVDEIAGVRQYAMLGALCGLSFLARIDSAFFALALAADILRRRGGGRPFIDVVKGLLLVTAIWAIFAVPWFILNLKISGSLLPTSGQAVRFLSQAYGFRLLGGNNGRARDYFPIDHIPLTFYTANVTRAMRTLYRLLDGVFPVWLGAVLLGSVAVSANSLKRATSLWFLYAALAAQFVGYTCYIFGSWFFQRYLVPFSLVYLLWLGIAVAHSVHVRRRAPDLLRAAVLIAVSSAVIWLAATSVEQISQLRSAEPHAFYKSSLWINRHTPPGAIIGAFQTGMLGYFLERKLYALDGKVNREALVAMKDKRIDRYVVDHGVDYLADEGWVLKALFVRRSTDESFLSRQVLVNAGSSDAGDFKDGRRFDVYLLTNPAVGVPK